MIYFGGAVKFPDSTIFYFCYNNNNDMICPLLFNSKNDIINCLELSDNEISNLVYPDYDDNQVVKENVEYYLAPKTWQNDEGITWTGQACRKTMIALTGLDPWDNDEYYNPNGRNNNALQAKIDDNYSEAIQNCPPWVPDWVRNYYR